MTFCFAFCSGASVGAAFAAGLVGLLRGPLTADLDGVIQIQSGPTIAHARDELTRIYLQRSEAPVLVFCDTDMEFNSGHVAALLALTDRAGVVGALYRGQIGGQAFAEAWRLVGGRLTPVEIQPSAAELVDVDAVGAGLIAIRREVFDDIAKTGPGEPMPWWSAAIRDGMYLEEDTEFCLRAREAGHRVAVAARVGVPHMKTVAVSPSATNSMSRDAAPAEAAA